MAQCIDEARRGSKEALGRLFEACRNYLLLIAAQEMSAKVKAKTSPSDVVQQTFLSGQRLFERFEGNTEKELLAWLRGILLNRVATARRKVEHEAPLHGPSLVKLLNNLPDDAVSPGTGEADAEVRRALRQALRQLPEHYRQVILLRNYQRERLSWEEIGRRLGRSAEAARKLWVRAIVELQKLLGANDDSG
ncbi:MAG TPA: sigma-70 family RNA polymerase sigma factor [Candidatus Solibacter sp.]|nr:sigma-70 family RNA polymerase sigma factor [Candidatus Solibacter sp.]